VPLECPQESERGRAISLLEIAWRGIGNGYQLQCLDDLPAAFRF